MTAPVLLSTAHTVHLHWLYTQHDTVLLDKTSYHRQRMRYPACKSPMRKRRCSLWAGLADPPRCRRCLVSHLCTGHMRCPHSQCTWFCIGRLDMLRRCTERKWCQRENIQWCRSSRKHLFRTACLGRCIVRSAEPLCMVHTVRLLQPCRPDDIAPQHRTLYHKPSRRFQTCNIQLRRTSGSSKDRLGYQG